MSTAMYDHKNFILQKIGVNQIKVIRKKDQAPTRPINIEKPIDAFVKKLVAGFLIKNDLLPKEEEDVTVDALVKFLEAVLPQSEPLTFEQLEIKLPPTTAVTPPPAIPVPPQAQLVTEEPPKDTTIPPAEATKESDIDPVKLKARFNDMVAAKVPHNMILQILSDENGVPVESVENIIAEIVPLSERIPTPETPPVIPNAVEPTPTQITLSQQVLDDIKSLSQSQKELLKKVAAIYQTDEKTLITRLVTEAEASTVPMHWQNKLLQHAIQNKLFGTKKEKGIHVLWASAEKAWDSMVAPEVDMRIDRCYQIVEKATLARCIGRSIGLKTLDLFPGLEFYKDVKPVNDVPTISRAFNVMKANITLLSKIYSDLKKSKDGSITSVVTGTILDNRGPYKETIWYLTVNDGSQLPRSNLVSIEIPEDNPFGIGSDALRNSIGKSCFAYGFVKLIPPSEKFSQDAIKVIPEFLVIG